MVTLLRDPTTQCGALALNYRYVPHPNEISQWDGYDFEFIQRLGPQAAKAYKPLQRPWWPEPDVPEMTPQLRERLKAHARKARGG